MFQPFSPVFGGFLAASLDADARAFVNAAGLTGGAQKSAVGKLVKNLKDGGLWAKLHAVYPFVGGTAAAHKFNLKDPRDLDAAYRLTFYGGWTHAATGVKGNGTTAYADTHFGIQAALGQNDLSLASYLRSGEIGGYDFGKAAYNSAFVGTSHNFSNFYNYLNSNADATVSSPSPITGFYVSSRNAAAEVNLYHNGSALGANPKNNASTGTDNAPLLIGVGNGQYSIREQGFAAVGAKLSAAEVAAFYAAVQEFQTTLEREV